MLGQKRRHLPSLLWVRSEREGTASSSTCVRFASHETAGLLASRVRRARRFLLNDAEALWNSQACVSHTDAPATLISPVAFGIPRRRRDRSRSSTNGLCAPPRLQPGRTFFPDKPLGIQHRSQPSLGSMRARFFTRTSCCASCGTGGSEARG